MKHYAPSFRAEALKLSESGVTNRTIAKKLKVPEPTISRWLRGKKMPAIRASKDSPTLAAAAIILRSTRLTDSQKVALVSDLLS